MKIETRKLSELKLLKKNVRKHGPSQIEALKKSVLQFGQTRAIVVDEDGNILIGNGLYQALVELGWEEASVYTASGFTEIQKKKLILTDNKVFELGINDFDTQLEFLTEIANTKDFDVIGFDEDMLKMLIDTDDDMGLKAVQEEALMKKESEKFEYTPEQQQEFKEESERAVVRQEKVESSETPDDTPLARKTILCPHCGEVIVLD